MNEPNLQYWYYKIRLKDGGFGWGDFIVCSNGFFAAYTDYSNGTFFWGERQRGKDVGIREFLVSAIDDYGNDYIINKMFPHQKQYNDQATYDAVTYYIRNCRRDREYTSEHAREEYELASRHLLGNGIYGYHSWGDSTLIPDCYEFYHEDYPASIKEFGSKLLPLLREEIKKELEQEKNGTTEIE